MSTQVYKHSLSVLVALFAAMSLYARIATAGYDARASELREILKKKELRDEKEREVLAKALDQYLKGRQECLDTLVRIIEESKADLIQEDQWLRRIDVCRSGTGGLADAIKSIPDTPSVGALNFVNVTQIEEVNFFTNLAKTKVGDRRDKITLNGMNVAKMKTVLEEKWRFLTDQDNSLDDYQKRIAEQLETMLDKAYDEADRERRTVKERLVGHTQVVAKFFKKYGKPIRTILGSVPRPEAQALADAVEGIEKLAPAVDQYARIWLNMNGDYNVRVGQYRAFLQSEQGGIYVLFGGFRRDTEDFLKNNGFDKAKIDYQAASDALSSWTSSSATSAQRSDAESVAKDVLNKLSNHLSTTEKLFNEFINAHKSKFFGPIGPDIQESLTETRVWENWIRVIQGKSLDSKLRVWRNEANNFFDIGLGELGVEDQEHLKGLLRDRTNELIRALEAAEKIPDKVKTDFDRSRLNGEIK